MILILCRAFTGGQWVNKGVLLETEPRTNLVTYSNDFSNTSWNYDSQSNHVTRTANSTISPDGNNNAWKLGFNRNSAQAYIAAGEFTYNGPYTITVYAKASELNYLVMSTGTYVSGSWGSFDLINGVVFSEPTNSAVSSFIEDVGNGWYRCGLTRTDDTGLEFCLITGSIDGTLNTTPPFGHGIFVYGAQYETGSTPSSYIPTSGSTVTRAADNLIIPSTNMSYSNTAMSFAMKANFWATEYTQNPLGVYVTNNNNFLQIECVDNSLNFGAALRVNGSNQGSNFNTITSEGYVDKSVGIRLNQSEITTADAGIVTGTNSLSDVGGYFLTNDSNMNMFAAGAGPADKFTQGTISTFRQWDEDITDAGIQEASS